MNFVEVAQISQIPSGSMKGFTVEGQSILVANYERKYYAIGNKCTHMGGDLSKGILSGKVVTCPRHRSQFDVTTGSRLAGAAKKNEPTYEVKIEGNSLKVGI